jgi:hypothetical protein
MKLKLLQKEYKPIKDLEKIIEEQQKLQSEQIAETKLQQQH